MLPWSELLAIRMLPHDVACTEEQQHLYMRQYAFHLYVIM